MVPLDAAASVSVRLADPEHRLVSAPASAIGNPAIVSVIASDSGWGQPLSLVPVTVSVTAGASPAPGV